MIGELYGHYRIISRLGVGGMGEVYLAEDERLHRKVALKFLAPDMARNEEAVERFRNEARVAAGLSHANIAAIHGFDHHEDRWFHVHELVEGETLEQRLSTGPLSIEDAQHLLVDLARGLGHAHARGVIHRDIKPANVMITPEGTAKILDFGLARRSGTDGMTVPGVAVGTVAFMSPEQIQGETADARSDLWSLGVLMYQSIGGSLPFAAPEMAAQMHKILSEEPRSLSELRPEVPAEMVACVERCLRKTRDERYARADDLLGAMGFSGDSRISQSTTTLPVQGSTSKRPIAITAGVLVLLLAIVGTWLGLRGDGDAGSGAGSGAELTAEATMAETVTVQDEFGQVTEQQIVDAQYRQKVTVFFSDTDPAFPDDEWQSDGIALLITMDFAQDPFVVAASPYDFLERVRREGSTDGHDLSQTLMRKIARERMSGWFVTSTLTRNENGLLRLEQTLHETESGRAMSAHVLENADPFELADQASKAIRQDLQIPEVLAGDFPDLPVKELMTDSEVAFRSCVLGLRDMALNNDFDGAAEHLRVSLEADSTFAFAHFMDFMVASVGQDATRMEQSGELMMRYAYRLPPPLQYAIKANFYISVEKEPDKALAVSLMWTQLHPDDEGAFRQLAALHAFRNEREEQIGALEEILRIDPGDFAVVHTIAQIHQDLGQFDDSAQWMQKYVQAFPERADGYEELAELYVDMGEREAALQQFERAELLDDRRASTVRGIAGIHVREGRLDEAGTRLDQAMRISSSALERAAVYQQRRGLFVRQGRIREALVQQQSMLDARAESMAPVQVLSIALASTTVYVRVDQAAEGLEIARGLTQELGAQFEAVGALGMGPLYVALDQPDSARAQLLALEGFVESYGVEQIRPWLVAFEAEIADLEGEHATAVELRERAVAQDPSDTGRKRLLAQSLRKVGQLQAARRELDAATALDPADPMILLERARVEEALGDTRAAREHLDQALLTWNEADPEFVDKQEALELRAALRE